MVLLSQEEKREKRTNRAKSAQLGRGKGTCGSAAPSPD